MRTPILVLAILLACSQPSDQGEPARIAWSRAVGFVDNGGTALDLEHKKIYMHLPEGLLEVNATGATNETDEKP